MSEPLTDRAMAILEALTSHGKQDLTDFMRLSAISQQAFGTMTHLGRLRNELGVLSWRGLVEQSTVEADAYRITPEGLDATI
jgi:DNA-binding IclR family transcriptional regulator